MLIKKCGTWRHFKARNFSNHAATFCSEQTAREIDCAVRDIVDQAYVSAERVLLEKRNLLQQGAKLLLEKETLSADEIPGSPVAIDTKG